MHVFTFLLQPLFACCGDMGYNENIFVLTKLLYFDAKISSKTVLS